MTEVAMSIPFGFWGGWTLAIGVLDRKGILFKWAMCQTWTFGSTGYMYTPGGEGTSVGGPELSYLCTVCRLDYWKYRKVGRYFL